MFCSRCEKHKVTGRNKLCTYCRKKDKIKKIKEAPPRPVYRPSKTVIVDECISCRAVMKKLRDLGYACFMMKRGTPDEEIRKRVILDKNYILITADKGLHNSLPSTKSILVNGKFKPDELNFLYKDIKHKL